MAIVVPANARVLNRGTRVIVVLVAVIVGAVVGVALREATDHDEAGIAAALGLPAIIALFGVFWLAEHWKDALTAAFAVTYFLFLAAALTGLVLPQGETDLPPGLQQALNGFRDLMFVVMAAYFGQEAVRAAAQAYSNAHVYGNAGTGGGGATSPIGGGQGGGGAPLPPLTPEAAPEIGRRRAGGAAGTSTGSMGEPVIDTTSTAER